MQLLNLPMRKLCSHSDGILRISFCGILDRCSAPEWRSGLSHCISVLEVSLQTPCFDSRLYHNRP